MIGGAVIRNATTRRWSVRMRLAVASTAVFLVVCGLTSVAIVHLVRARVEERMRDDATTALSRLTVQAEAGVPLDELSTAGAQWGAVRVLDSDGTTVRVLGGTGRLPPELDPGAGTGAGAEPATYAQTAVSPAGVAVGGVDVLTVSDVALVGGVPFTFVAEHPLADVQRSVDAIADTLALVTPLVALGLGVAVWVIAGRALRPVDSMRDEVEEITHSTLHRRLTVPRADDEVRRLGVTMNGMLDRLESAADRQRAFVADASHELRTPVTVVRSNLEVGLRGGDADALRVAAERALDANRRLQGIIDDLLDLARLEAPVGTEPPRRAPVDLDELVFEQLRERRASPTVDGDAVRPSIDGHLVGAARVDGDASQLGRVIGNLLDNAVAHARRRIEVSLQVDEAGACLAVSDDGPGVAPGERESIFERFTRLDDGRDRRHGGAGLGLAITRRIVEAHGGTIHVGEAPDLGGARFEVRLPAQASPERSCDDGPVGGR